MNQLKEIVDVLNKLADRGITTSICYGKLDGYAIMYSVDVLTKEGLSFEKPIAAYSLKHSVDIAMKECIKLGFYTP